MRKFILLFIFLCTLNSHAQKKLQVIRAESVSARIYEEGNAVSGWNISPKIKLDIFTTNKLTKVKTVKFVTDTDSVSFKIKPGQSHDFIVLLNGKDSCFTRIQSPEVKNFSKLKPEVHDSIPFVINKQNTFYFKAVLNKTDTLNLNFDTGTTGLSIIKDTLRSKVKSNPKLYNKLHELELGNRKYKTLVYDTELSGHDSDGRFGWDIFDGMVVELNYDKNIMVVHSKLPKSVKNDKSYTKVDIHYLSQLFFIDAGIFQGGVVNSGKFLYDTGYQKGLMLDNDLLTQDNFPSDKMEVTKKVIMHGATGNEIPVINCRLEKLQIGKYNLTNVPAQLLTANKPIHNNNIHILGNEVLKRFNAVLDFQENVVYLKPNASFNASHVEERG